MPSATVPARSLPLVAIALAAFVLVINVRIFVGGKTWDDIRYHTEIAPPRLAAAESIRSLRVPAWFEGTSFGVPLLAEPSHGAMVPAVWLSSSPRSLDWIQLVHLAWCALGIAVWARGRRAGDALSRQAGGAGSGARPGSGASSRAGSSASSGRGAASGAAAGSSDPAALVAGLLVVTAGILASATVRGALPGLAHLPWIGACAAHLAIAETRYERARVSVALAALLALVALSGVFVALMHGVLIALVFGLARAPHAGTGSGSTSSTPGSGSSGDARGTRWWLVGAIGAACAIGAVQWLPAFLHLPRSAGETVHHLPFARLVELIVPGSFGSVDPARGVHALAGDHPWAPSLFVGAPLVALAAVCVPRARVLALIGALVAFAFVAGRGGWPAWIGAPELHVATLAVVLGVHAAAGLDVLIGAGAQGTHAARARYRRALRALGVAIGCTLVALLALGLLRAKHADAQVAIDRALLDGGLGLVCTAGALLLAWRAGRARDDNGERGNVGDGDGDGDGDGVRWHVPVILALLVLPNAGAQGSLAPLARRDAVMREPAFASVLDGARASSEAPVRVFRPAFMHDAYADLDEEMATLGGSSAARWGLVGARSESAARSALHDKTWLAAAQEGGALLDRFGIGVAILPATMVDSPRSQFVELSRRGGWALVALPVAPVASVVRSWLWQRDPDEALGFMFTRGGGTSLHRGTIVLGGGGPAGASPLEPSPCAVQRWEPGEIELACTDAGYAVVTSSAASGWMVSVNGEERTWHAADVLRRAVKVGANARVVWSYQTPGFAPGLMLAAVGVLLLAILLVAGGNRPLPDDVN